MANGIRVVVSMVLLSKATFPTMAARVIHVPSQGPPISCRNSVSFGTHRSARDSTSSASGAAGAGIALTAAGAPFPYGNDPDDQVIRLAPTYPPLAELAEALDGLVLCIKLAAVEHLIDASVTR